LLNIFQELESQSSVEIELLKDQLRSLEESLDDSKRSKDYLEQDIRALRQQLDYAQEDSYKQKTNINTKVQEKELEIEKLRNQV
jgi:predicted  nucleic acid-binding Zn-ribbon protein